MQKKNMFICHVNSHDINEIYNIVISINEYFLNKSKSLVLSNCLSKCSPNIFVENWDI